MDPAGLQFRNTKDLMKGWGSEIHMEPHLHMELLEYVDECEQLIRQQHYNSLLPLLSPTLRGKVALSTHGVWVVHVPFFKCDDPRERNEFIMAVA